jgi:AcrR family transcriptional regulator
MIRIAAEKGLQATTVDGVASAAGVGVDSFYEMFEDKEACFLEAYDAIFDVVVARMTASFEAASEESWPERVVAVLRALVELLSAEAAIARMAMVEVSAGGGIARARYRAALERFRPFLEEGRRYSPQGEDLPADTAAFAVGGATSMIFDEFRGGRGTELEKLLPQLVFAVLMPYLGPAVAGQEMERVTGEA